MSEYLKSKLFFWVATTVTVADVIQWTTGFVGLVGACFMATAGYYSMRIKKRELNEEDEE